MKGIEKLLIIILITITSTIQGQNLIKSKTIQGKVTDTKGISIPYANVSVKDRTIGTTTNEDGSFSLSLKNTPPDIILQASCIGYDSVNLPLHLKNTTEEGLTIILQSVNKSIEEVTVSKKSKTTEKNEIPYAITAIDAKPMQTRNLDVNQLLNTVTGIKIREAGGLGSNYSFTLNGFTDNQIKFFIDGIPMDYFGSSLRMNNFPVNMISSVEVYKGVIPIEFGSDALGGAVNFVTNQSTKSFIDASYSYGSYNTHRAAVISQYIFPKTGLQLKVNAFYNYSDNNYKIWVNNVDAETGNIDGEVKIRQFHDGYESKSGQVDAGFSNKKFADKLFVGIIGATNYDEIQRGYNINKAIGEAFNKDQRMVLSLKYLKRDLFLKNFDAKLLATYIDGTSQIVDTSYNTYDWYGNYTTKDPNTTSGEFTWFKTLFKYNDKSATNSLNLAYEFLPGHKLVFNNTYLNFTRTGDDPTGYYAELSDNTNKLTKDITGLSYEINLFHERLKGSVFGKYFYMNANMYDHDDNDDVTAVNSNFKDNGTGIAISYFIIPELQVKASYENTYRIPENEEMFGDGLQTVPNPNLIPEHSKNLNFNLAYRKQIEKNNFDIGISYLYRLADDFIKKITSGNQSDYENFSDVKINCVETELKYNYNNKLRFNLSGTYQNIIDNDETSTTYEDRVPNMPYLFGNGNIDYQFTPFKNKTNKMSLNWNTNFVEEFYLKAPSLGSSNKSIIPRQLSHDISLSLLLFQGKYNLSLACTNITNMDLYDDYKLQKPGRAISAKFRLYIDSVNK